MEINQLMQAVQELVGAQSPADKIAVLQRHPELLDQSSIDTLLELAKGARNAGQDEMAEALRLTAQLLSNLRNAGGTSESSPEDTITIQPVTPGSSVPWARLTRRVIALRSTEILEQAIIEAEQCQEMEIAALLQALQNQDYDAIENQAPRLHHSLLKSGRNEEAWTIALVGLTRQVALSELYNRLPGEQQAKAFEIGIQACQQSLYIAQELGDEACQAFFKMMEGIAHYRWRNFGEAEKAYRGALAIRRKLSLLEPELFESYLANTLNNLGNVLADIGDLEGAEITYREAAAIQRKLSMAEPQNYEPALSMTLNNLGTVQSALNRFVEAVESYREALDIRRKLSILDPLEYQPRVAVTLHNLGMSLDKLNRFAEAEETYREALTIERPLIQVQPSLYEPSLAATLNNLGVVQMKQNRLSHAEEMLRESITLRRRLSKIQPHIYETVVAEALNNLGIVLRRLNRLNEAEEAYCEGLTINRKLAAGQPQTYRPKVASSLNNLGVVLRELRRLEEAEDAFLEALAIRKTLAQSRPQVYEPDVAMTLDNLGNVLSTLRRLEEADAFYQEALAMRRKLAREEPLIYQPDLASTLSNMGLVLRDLRRLEEAENAYREALTIRRELAQSQPQVYEPSVATALDNLGTVLRELRRFEEAEEHCQEALTILRRLALAQPEVYDDDIAMTLNHLGLVRDNLHRSVEAEEAYRESLEILRKLAERQPQAYEWNVAMTLGNLGNVLLESERPEEAENAYREALAIRRNLALDRPHAYEMEVAGTLNNMGNVLLQRACFNEAEEAYREGLTIERKLAKSLPQVHQRNVALMLGNLGNVLEKEDRLEEAEEVYLESLDLCRQYDIPNCRITALSRLSESRMRWQMWDQAADLLREAMDQVERLRAEIPGLDRRMQIVSTNFNIYENLIICLMNLALFDEALEVVERGKSRTLIDLLALRDLRPKNVPMEIFDEYERTLLRARTLEDQLQSVEILSEDLQTLSPDKIADLQKQQLEELRNERLSTNTRLRALANDIHHYDPDFLPYAKPLEIKGIKSLAGESGTTLVIFRVTESGSYIFLVFPSGRTDVVQVPEFSTSVLSEILVKIAGDEVVDGWVMCYYDCQASFHRAQQTKKKEDEEIARRSWQNWLDTMDTTLGEVYRRLLDPVHQRLKEQEQTSGESIKRVVMVPNRGLAILPLHACWWEEGGERRYLLDEYIINYAPSLSVFKRCLERERAGRSRQTLLGIANPKPPGNLHFSDWECEEIERILGNDRCLFLWGEDATKEEMKRWVGERNWLHFSCHGQYRLDDPFSSSLQLAKGDQLTLGEILEDLDLQHTWLTVLSACETGLVDFREIADEHYGLPMGFIYAGAPTVWGTLWMVNDLSTALLMREAYNNLIGDGVSKPEALRNAQQWLRDAKAEKLLELVSAKQVELGYDRMAWTDLSPFKRAIEHRYSPDECPYKHPYFWAGMQCVGV